MNVHKRLNKRGRKLLKAERIEHFNKLRDENPDWIPDLRGICGTGILIRAISRRWDLSGANLSKANLEGVDFDYFFLIDTNFEEARLEGASFVGAVLAGAIFKKTSP